MIKVLPFSALKRHLQGEIFTPVDMGAHYELQSATRVMCGSNGNTYRFKTAENAALWLDTNTIKAVKNQITKQSAIDSLIIKNMGAPSDWLAEEIATLQARANGDWAAFHTGEDLLEEWGIVAKGDKGEKGDAGAAGAAGVNILKSVVFKRQLNATFTGSQTYIHGLGGLPDFYNDYYECTVEDDAGYAIGDKIKVKGAFDSMLVKMTATNIIINQGSINAFYYQTIAQAVHTAAARANKWAYCVQAFRIVNN